MKPRLPPCKVSNNHICLNLTGSIAQTPLTLYNCCLGNDCVWLWCMAQCRESEKCLKWSYQAVSGGKTLCTLHGASAKLAPVKCINGKCNSAYGSCTGTWE